MDYGIFKECPVDGLIEIASLFTFFQCRFGTDYAFKGESHNFYEAVCVLDGKVGITADKNVYILSAGQMIVHPPMEFHAIWSDCGSEPEIIIFSFRADRISAPARGVFALSPERTEELKEALRLAKRAFTFGGDRSECVENVKDAAAAAAVCKKLELFLLSALYAGADPDPKYRGRSAENYYHILSVMESHLCEGLGVSELASLCRMSVPALEKTVFRYLRCGAISYYNNLRMQKAAELLKGGMSVKETALTLGFSNQNYFSSGFKKWAGVSPSQVKNGSVANFANKGAFLPRENVL